MKAIIKEIININLSTSYQYILGENLLENLEDHIGLRTGQSLFLIIDEKVNGIYGSKIDSGFLNLKNNNNRKLVKYILKSGEEQKNFSNLEAILNKLADHGFIQTDLILGIGGGVVGDITGLAAGLYMRGMDHAFVATTTLSAVDSSVGGKTAINLGFGKNLVGMFKQPSRVLCDIGTFDSLDKRTFNEGLVEAFKMGLIRDKILIKLFDKDLSKDKKRLTEVIKRSVVAKYHIVKNDEKDQNIRRILNFGHTLGHAIEQKSNYQIKHGEAVAIGIKYMVNLAIKEGILKDQISDWEIKQKFQLDKVSELVDKVFSIMEIDLKLDYSIQDLMEFMTLDKKIDDNDISLVFMDKIGSAILKSVKVKKLEGYLENEA